MDQDAPRPSAPVPVPVPSSDRHSYLYESPADFVGSPEQVSSLPSHRSALYSTSSNLSQHPSRPSFHRSASSMTANQRRTDRVSRVQELASSFIRRHDRSQSREWTVFGQLMADDTICLPPPRTSVTVHPTPHVTSPRPLSNGDRPTSSYFDIPASGYGVHDPFEGEHTPTRADRSSRAVPSSQLDHTTAADQSDSDSNGSRTEYARSPSESTRKWYSLPQLPTLTTVQRNILKCCIAYFIGSLFTFSPYLSAFIADITSDDPGDRLPSPSGHMVATVAVYFNPAKTLGGMVEADVFCMMGLIFATFVSLSSMSVYWFFELQPGWEWLADLLVVVMIGVGMSIVAWMKVWMAKPTFNTACSMTAIILFVVVIKEGGLQTLMQVAFIIVVGALVSNVVCLLIWPQRATKNLQNNMTKTLDSFSTLLGMLTQTFLLEEPHGFTSDRLQRAVSNHQASFTSLKKSLVEAQSERLFGGPGRVGEGAQLRGSSGQAYEDAIDSLNRLGQHLNGLRSGISLQHELIRGHREGKVILKKPNGDPVLVDNTNGNGNGKGKVAEHIDKPAECDEDTAMLQAAATVFGDLMDDLGPPLKALSTTCVSTLKRLREAFVQPRDDDDRTSMQPTDFVEIADSIERALFTFESTSNHAVLRMYRNGNISVSNSRASIGSFGSAGSDNQMLLGDESENVFLAYFFIFTMQEYARELISLVDAMSRICSIERANAARSGVLGHLKALIGVNWKSGRTQERPMRGKRSRSIRRRFSAYFTQHRPHKAVSFPKVTPHAPNTIQTPARENLTFIGRVKQSLWAFGARMKQQDMKYAIKAGMATAMLASPAFLDSTRPIFVEYKGEWALISFFVVISPTIGATNFMGVHRVLGTLLGAATAFVVWSAFPENPWVLSIFGFFYSIPCFYYIIAKPQYATSARFVLLTYNLTCLYCYNLRDKDVAVFDIAFHRAVAVTIGVVWAAIVSRYWWPAEARRELSRALGEFCLNIGWLYTRLVAFNSFSDEEFHLHAINEEDNPTEESHLLHVNPALSHSIQHFMAMELHLQIKLIELQGLLSQTQHEPRLKGPFPVALYRSILTSLQSILDRLHSMRCVTSREEWHTTVRRDFIIPVNRERREMVGNVILYFSVLASAFRLKSPLPPYLPPAEEARQRLVDAIRKLDVVRNRDVKGSRHLLFFAYALTMKAVIQELDYLGHTLQDAFGVIGQSRDAFENLFEQPGPSDAVNSV
ncbi:Fusaric acid resistance protein-like-domain-containing protein [Earliella scabrosa]|nr:Fusaric acid resistance protein-like-domain-containing protein [Earliella scabrosa]